MLLPQNHENPAGCMRRSRPFARHCDARKHRSIFHPACRIIHTPFHAWRRKRNYTHNSLFLTLSSQNHATKNARSCCSALENSAHV
jgi:hypothetical protein